MPLEEQPRAFTCNPNGRAKRIDYLLHTADLRANPWPVPAITDTTPLPSDNEASEHLLIAATLVPQG
jgi:hypothetical protein